MTNAIAISLKMGAWRKKASLLLLDDLRHLLCETG